MVRKEGTMEEKFMRKNILWVKNFTYVKNLFAHSIYVFAVAAAIHKRYTFFFQMVEENDKIQIPNCVKCMQPPT